MALGKRIDDLDVLARSRLLAHLPIKDVSEFLDLLDQVALPPGTALVREGDDGDYMFFVLEGEARIRRGQLELSHVHPGDHFGELAMLGASKRSATVEALTTMRLARLSRARYLSLATNHPRIALHFTQALASGLGEELVAMTDNVGLLAYQRSLPRTLSVKVKRDADTITVATGTIVGTILPKEENSWQVVGATIDRKPASLETAVVADVAVSALTVADWEGRMVLRRSAALVFLEAARRAAPEVALTMGPPLENGTVVRVLLHADTTELAERIGEELARLCRDDAPLREEVWQIEEARSLLMERGLLDAAALLPSRREATISLLTCGETFALALGPIVPRSSFLFALSVRPHPEGLFLDLGPEVHRALPGKNGTHEPSVDVEVRTPRYGAPMTRASREWLAEMGITGVGRFNEHCVSGNVAEVIRVAEGFHEKWIGRVADLITERKNTVKVVVIAGPSSSGKTTFIKRLTVQLLVNGIRPKNVSLDDYYVDREKTVKDENGELDFEAFEALDTNALKSQLARLFAGQKVRTSHYDFKAGKSHPDGGDELSLGPSEVLLLEGIHGLNPDLVGDSVPADSVFRVFVHPATTLAFDKGSVLAPDDVRLLRRIVRDRHTRNNTAADTIMRWPSVRRGELLHIYPFLPNADAVFDSALVYELSVLKTYAERYLLEVPSTHPAFTTAYRLRQLIDQFVAIYPDHVPPTSVLREFIGGSGFEY
jgi:uridine kinase